MNSNPRLLVEEYCRCFNYGQPSIECLQLSSNPVIYECIVTYGGHAAGLSGSGLGKSMEEAQRTAYLHLYEQQYSLIQASQNISQDDSDIEMLNSMPYYDKPKDFLHALANKYQRKVIYTEEQSYKFSNCIASLIPSIGLEAKGSGVSKKEATNIAALRLCKLVDDHIKRYGGLFNKIPEYEGYLDTDLEDKQRYAWYQTPKNEVTRIASKIAGTIPAYQTQMAPLDPTTFICKLVVDEDVGLIGFGRSYSEKEATRLAAVDLCRRFADIIKSKSSLNSRTGIE